MTTGEWLNNSTRLLHEAGVNSARLDCLVLLADTFDCDKSFMLAHPESVIDSKNLKILNTKIIQRSHHTPLAYLRGKADFYGREFKIAKHVLVPRPESEAMIEQLLKQAAQADTAPATADAMTVYDIGTGSGCLAITAALELPFAEVVATDIDQRCLDLARQNATRWPRVSITLLKGDLLTPIATHISSAASKKQIIFLANLPYVPTGYPVNKAATHEPALALFSGQDGLDHYRKLFCQLTDLPMRPAFIITESLRSQHADLSALANVHGYTLHASRGLSQSFRLAD